jgi:hypothetical protein
VGTVVGTSDVTVNDRLSVIVSTKVVVIYVVIYVVMVGPVSVTVVPDNVIVEAGSVIVVGMYSVT